MEHINLMYHDIFKCDILESGFTRERDLPYKISESNFERQVQQIDSFCKLKGLPHDYVVFTFDDGGKSFYTIAAKILEKYDYRGLFFISSKFIGSKNFLSEQEIISLHHAGHIIGSHAHSHQHLYELTDQQVDDEWKVSINTISSIINAPIYYASIPNGDISQRVLHSTRKYGIKYLYTSEPTTNVEKFEDMELHGRYVVLADSTIDHVLSIISSSRVRYFLACKRRVLCFVKYLLGDNYLKLKSLIYRK